MPGLTEKEIHEIRCELDDCSNPLFYFHDDADGVTSFLQLYRLKKQGNFCMVKSSTLGKGYLRKIEEYEPDKIFILDIAQLHEDFLEGCNIPTVWIDHHTPQDVSHKKNFRAYNPKKRGIEKNRPVAYLCYQIANKDLWLGMIGCVGDWTLPEFSQKFSEDYPELLSSSISAPEEALFNSDLGKIIRIVSFVLKGRTSEVTRAIKLMSRIDDPRHILEKTSEEGKKLFKMYDEVNKNYEKLLTKYSDTKQGEDCVVFKYKDSEMSFTKELSNELLYRNPGKIIVIGRDNGDEVKLSLRARDLVIPPILDKILAVTGGTGGGHEHACGAIIKSEQYRNFLELLKKETKLCANNE